MAENPYSLMFGRIPKQYISRPVETDDIISDFYADIPSQTVYIITGIRGQGKTVLLTDIEKRLSQDKKWTVVNLIPSEPDLVDALAKRLLRRQTLKKIFMGTSVDISLFGLNLHLSNGGEIYDPASEIEDVLQEMERHGRRLLVTIDEASKTEQMRTFAGTFQSLMRRDLPIFLLMTGLYENIESLQETKDLTFLYRAPKVMLSPLDIGRAAENYEHVLSLPQDQAVRYASETKGYSFAFQTLGYYLWRYGNDGEKAVSDAIDYVGRYSYRKIYAELSEKEKKIIQVIAKSGEGRVSDILRLGNLTNGEWSPYRRRLIDKDILTAKKRGYVSFTLPWFGRFVRNELLAEDTLNVD